MRNGDIKAEDYADIVYAAIATARMMNAEQILLALSWLDTRRRDLSVRVLRAQPLPVLLLPDRSVRQVFSQAGVESPSIELQRAPLSKLERAAKRTGMRPCRCFSGNVQRSASYAVWARPRIGRSHGWSGKRSGPDV
jgi:hypothetical protein